MTNVTCINAGIRYTVTINQSKIKKEKRRDKMYEEILVETAREFKELPADEVIAIARKRRERRLNKWPFQQVPFDVRAAVMNLGPHAVDRIISRAR
jgi:hypothetical protein